MTMVQKVTNLERAGNASVQALQRHRTRRRRQQPAQIITTVFNDA